MGPVKESRSMITQQELIEYLKRVPALPDTLKNAMDALKAGDLSGAATAAADDKALMFYLKHVVNSAAYGFRTELHEAPQIFSALGLQRAKQLLYAYMVSLLAPESWVFFDIDQDDFRNFQVELMRDWEKLIAKTRSDEKYLPAAAVISAGLVVADGVFGKRKKDVELLTSVEPLDLDTILKRLGGMNFQQLVDRIAEKWEVDEDVRFVIDRAFAVEPCDVDEDERCRLAALLHLLLFYALSRPVMLSAGANGFIEFKPEFVGPVMHVFEETMELT